MTAPLKNTHDRRWPGSWSGRLATLALLRCLLLSPTVALAAQDGYPPPPGSYPLGPAWEDAALAPDNAVDEVQSRHSGLLLPDQTSRSILNGGFGSTLFGSRPIEPSPAPMPTAPLSPSPWPDRPPPMAADEPPRSDFSMDFSRRSAPTARYDAAAPYAPEARSNAPYPGQSYGTQPIRPMYQAPEPRPAPTPSAWLPDSLPSAQGPDFANAPALQPAPPASGSSPPPLFRPPELMAQ